MVTEGRGVIEEPPIAGLLQIDHLEASLADMFKIHLSKPKEDKRQELCAYGTKTTNSVAVRPPSRSVLLFCWGRLIAIKQSTKTTSQQITL